MDNTHYASHDDTVTHDDSAIDVMKKSDLPRGSSGRLRADSQEKDFMYEPAVKYVPFKGLAARRRSRLKLWLSVLGKWFITVAFIGVIYTILAAYESYEVISEKQKKHFNVLMTGFLIALGLVTTSQLIHATSDLRWWILSRRPRSRRKVRVILHAQSLTHVLALAIKSSRLSIHLSVAVWGLLLLGSQIGYASLGLCYSISKTEDQALMVNGKVAIANLSTIQTQKITRSTNGLKAQQYTANSFGTISLAFNVGDPEDMPLPGSLWSNDDDNLFCGANYCSYVFHEINNQTLIEPNAIPVIATTNRSVNATAQCSSYRVIRGGNGTDSTISIMAGSREVEIQMPSRNGPEQTTFITSMEETCGDDCSFIKALEASSTNPWFYNCISRLGLVANASMPEQRLGPSLTRLATAAIALQGYTTAEGDQFRSYPAEAVFGNPLNGSTESMELLLSRFVIGVISSAAESNDYIVVDGQAPTIGQKLDIGHWEFIHLIFMLTTVLQLLFAVLVTALAERVIAPKKDALAEAKVVQAMVSIDHPHSALKEIENNRSRPDKLLWKYTSRYLGMGIYDLYMERVEQFEQHRI